jgi:hypothetical protein
MPAGDRGSVFIWIEGHVITANQGLVPDPARRNAVASYSAVYGHVATAGEAPIMAYIYENGGYDTVNGRGTEVARFNGFIDANGNIVPSSEIGVIPPGGSYVLSVHLIETSGVPRELGRDTFVTQPL